MIQKLLTFLFVASLISPAMALSPATTDARKIMEAVNKNDDGDKRVANMTITVKDDAGRTRKRQLRSWSMDFKAGTKNMMLFSGPSDVRNTGLLSVDYDDGNKTDDQWLYLPSLRKSTRIASGDKSGSFMGTDLSYNDMTRQDPSHYKFKLLAGETKVAGETCWKIESTPKTAKAKKESGYLKSHVWVSKDKLLVLQIQNWIREGRKIKQVRFGQVKKVAGIWVPHKISARTLRSGKA